jgi:tRNA modification GTPase
MQDRALTTISSADVVVLVHDCTDPRPPPALDVKIDVVVHTKLDLSDRAPPGLAVSAKTGANLDALRARLDAIAFGNDSAAGAGLALNARHVEAITDARHALRRALDVLDTRGPEVVALELREALDALGRILGSVTPDDVIGRIFAAFCIGK